MAKKRVKLTQATSRALQIVRKYAPKVEVVQDATEDLTMEVTKADCASKAVKDHQACAMAVACKRKLHLDDVIISRSMAYLVRGKVATRYELPETVSREVIAFDRGGAFQPGEYELVKPEPYNALGSSRHETGGSTHVAHSGGRGKAHHITKNVRAFLGRERRADAE
jgi:hypothetical protein